MRQCSLIITCSDLPTSLTKKTHQSLSTIHFTIVHFIDPNKAHGHYMISIRMVKLCGASLCKSLELIFNHVLKVENFLLNGKKQMSFLRIKKETSKYWKITVPYLCFPLLEKCLKEYCIIICLNFLQKMI